MNRAQRRNAKRNPAHRTKQQIVHDLQKNGITIADLDKNHRIGYEEGWDAAKMFYLNVCYASAIRTLKKNANVNAQQCAEFLKEMDEMVSLCMTDEDAVAAAFAEAGVEFNFAEVFSEDRITEVGA